MRSLIITILVISLAFIGNSLAIPKVYLERVSLREKEGINPVIPSAVARIAALEFKGLLSDAIFSKVMTYYGGKLIKEEELTDEEWDWFYKSIDLATELDPYFLDPYYLGAMNLPWAKKTEEANTLLEKALKNRDWDWSIPFYLGFNNFYFLHDNEKAASYLMEASRLPGSSPLLAALASRLAYKGNKTENAIIFLQEIINKTEDETIRKSYEERLNALKRIFFLERAVAAYQNKFNKMPEKIEDLIVGGIIRDIPKDPYGGTFYIDKDRSIKTTSEMVHKKG